MAAQKTAAEKKALEDAKIVTKAFEDAKPKTDKDIAEEAGPTLERPDPEHELNPDAYRAPKAY